MIRNGGRRAGEEGGGRAGRGVELEEERERLSGRCMVEGNGVVERVRERGDCGDGERGGGLRWR